MNLMRSSVVPQTIARETAQNMNWKMKNAALAPPKDPSMSDPAPTVSPKERKNPLSPASHPAPPKAMPKPSAHQTIVAMEKFTRIFATPEPTFLPRENPISRNRNPACMNITSTAATITHVELSSETSFGIATCGSTGASCANAAAGNASSPAAPAREPRARLERRMHPPRSA
jgi:hypothetical protein